MMTLEFRDSNRNGIEDRSEGIYRGRDIGPTGPLIGGDLLGAIDAGPATPSSSRPPGGLSYEADIAPLQRRFFQDVEGSALSMEEKNAAVFGMADNMMKLLDMRQKIESSEQGMRLRELQYRSTLESLQSARRKAQTEQRMLDALPSITAELDGILQDPNLDSTAKERMLARWGVRNAGVLSGSPGVQIAFGAAKEAIDATKVDPVSFAANVRRLGLDPSSAEVAAMPGASPLGIKLAIQSYEREQAEENEVAKAKMLRELAEVRATTQKEIIDRLSKVEFKEYDPSKFEGVLDRSTGAVKDKDGNVLYNVNDFNDEESRLAVDDILLFGTPEERVAAERAITGRQKFQIAMGIRNRLLVGHTGIEPTKSKARSGFTE